MPPSQLSLRASTSSRALWIAAACAAALGAAFACTSRSDVHESDDAKGKPCFQCHSGAYNAAVNPRHVDSLPQTCQDCHSTKAWVPSTATNHPYWPILNKHVGVACAACHTKGYKVGDTPKDCVGCHRKDYEAPKDPNAGGFTSHFSNGVEEFPLDCATCHSDVGFKPSTWKHLPDFPSSLLPEAERPDGGLAGRHFNAPCVGCHTGKPPTYKGTPTDSDCTRCHNKADADKRAQTNAPSHPNFPLTCQDCHLMSGWKQGGPLLGTHPVEPTDAGLPFQLTGAHDKTKVLCRECHKVELGPAPQNMDCIHCHLDGVDHHVIPDVDAKHLGGTGALYQNAQAKGPPATFCLSCHAQGQHLP